MQTTTFKASMDASRAKSRGRMPIVVLIVLVMLLLSSIAYAAYWAVTGHPLFQAPVEFSQASEEVVEPVEETISPWVVNTATYNRTGRTPWVGTYEYDEEGKLVCIHGSEVLIDPGMTDYSFEYDDQGRLANVYVVSADGANSVLVQSISYDEQGRVTSTRNIGFRNGLVWEANDVTFAYDESGFVTFSEVRSGFAEEGPGVEEIVMDDYTTTITYEYENGHITGFRYIEPTSGIEQHRRSSDFDAVYDESGNLTSWTSGAGSGGETSRTFTYKRIDAVEGEFVPSEYTNPTGWCAEAAYGWPYLPPLVNPVQSDRIVALANQG